MGAETKISRIRLFRVMLVHSVVRLLIDFIRQHSPLIGPFVLTQILAIGFIILTLALIIRKEIQHK